MAGPSRIERAGICLLGALNTAEARIRVMAVTVSVFSSGIDVGQNMLCLPRWGGSQHRIGVNFKLPSTNTLAGMCGKCVVSVCREWRGKSSMVLLTRPVYAMVGRRGATQVSQPDQQRQILRSNK